MTMDDAYPPFAPDQLDELLSAQLDGELADAARDLGMSLHEVTARLHATPGANARRVALTSARDLLGRPVEIDELTTVRLHARAIREVEGDSTARVVDSARRRRRVRYGAVGIAAAAAAVVALVVGLGGHVSPNDSASNKSAAAVPATTAPKRTGAPVPTAALGAFTDAGTLARAAVEHSTHSTSDPTENGQPDPELKPAQGPAPSAGNQLATGGAFSAANPESASRATAPVATGASGTTGAAACKAPPQVPVTDAPVLRATATLSGKAVIVLLFAGLGEHIVVIEDLRCGLVNLQMFG